MIIQSILNLKDIDTYFDDREGIFLILASEKSKDLCTEICNYLKDKNQDFIGGYFPQIIFDYKSYTEGVVLNKIITSKKPILFKNMGSDSIEAEIHEKIYKDINPDYTCLTWLDGLSPDIHGFLTHLYSSLGPSLKYLGGGAGSLSLKQEPCIFTKEGVFENAAVLLLIDKNWNLDVKHGWEAISDEIVATEVNGNTILKLNWEPASEIYEEILKGFQDKKITVDNFFSISKHYPLGLCKESDEYVVRDPIIMNEDKSLTCIGNVPKGSKIQVLSANKDKLIQAAKDASKNTFIEKNKTSQSLIIDCISRTIFLGDRFNEELIAAQSQADTNSKSISIGALTLGEIASSSNGFLELYNKSFVIGVTND